jgi:parallel beta-helix repeat protein
VKGVLAILKVSALVGACIWGSGLVLVQAQAGTHFQVEDSEYYDVSLTSTVPIGASVQSISTVITIAVEKSTAYDMTQFTLGGLLSETTYYKYEDNFHNLIEFTTDENGEYRYTQDLSAFHFIIIQPHKSTKFIKDDAAGGDCVAIGIWDQATKTCTLTTDVSETIQMESSGITLDGNGFGFTQKCCIGTGVYVNGHHGIVVKNVLFRHLSYSITLINASNVTVTNNSFVDVTTAVFLYASSDNKLIDNEILRGSSKHSHGIGFDVTFGSARNTILRNNISEKATSIWLYSGANENIVAYNTISASTFIGLRMYASSRNEIFNNNFVDNVNQVRLEFGSDNLFHLNAPVGGNYWSSFDSPAEGCFDQNEDGFCDSPYSFAGGSDHLPWAVPITEPPELNAGASNVLFIPGFQGSRLYRQSFLGEDELWVPTRNQDAEQLFLNEAGQPLDANIYTRDIIDRTKFIFPIYEGFIDFMDKEMVGAGIINEWRALPYDWRLAVDEVATQPSLKQGLEELVASSDSGKVTVITHSNGGLVAKMALSDPAIANQVDRLIMVATPQLGTPKALAALLHGEEQELGMGAIMNKKTARELGENMPGAYGLLPFAGYFNAVADPVIQFTDEVVNSYDFRSIYGESIDSFAELAQFLAGDNGGRTEPAENDLNAPNVLNMPLLNRALDLHDNSLDNWSPPAGVEVIQIAGWGLDTIYALEYDDCDFCPFGQNLSNLDRDLKQTIDGDGTVVLPSAVGSDFKKYFLNILEFNKDNFINKEHKNILEVAPLQELLNKIVIDDLAVLPSHISENKPDPILGDTRYRLRMKSPVAVHVYDSVGRHTGLIDNPNPQSDLQLYEEEIPNSSYFELGDKKYLSLDGEDIYTIELKGEGIGTFTLEIDEVQGDTVIDTTAYQNIPVTPATTGKVLLQDSLVELELELDVDGDGQTDAVIQEGVAVPLLVSLAVLQQSIAELDAHHSVITRLSAWASAVEHFVNQEKTKQARQHSEKLEDSIRQLVDKKNGLSKDQAELLLRIVAQIINAL